MVRPGLALVAGLLLLTSCRTAYYGAMESVGVHKRDILVDRVKTAQGTQEEAKVAFVDALEQFGSVVNYDGGALESKYRKLDKAFRRSEERATAVHERIKSVEVVAGDLFKEWRAELKQYTSKELRARSKQQYDLTMSKYKGLIAVMKKSASSMDPVLNAFRDQVLFLKHNLNATAIGSIQAEAQKIQDDVAILIRDMEKSIAEAKAFIAAME